MEKGEVDIVSFYSIYKRKCICYNLKTLSDR